MAEDYANRAEIAKLLRFRSTRSAGDEPDVSLDDYAGRMKEGQEKIYYLLAPTPAAAASSPLLETFRKQGVEVLLFGEAVDHWVASSLQDYDGKRLVSAGQEVPDFGGGEDSEDGAAAAKEAAAGFAGLTAKLKDALGGKVHEVRVSSRLTDIAGLHRARRAGDRPEPDAADQRQWAAGPAGPGDQPGASADRPAECFGG